MQKIAVLLPTQQNQASTVLLGSPEIPQVCQSPVTVWIGRLNAITDTGKPRGFSLAPFWPGNIPRHTGFPRAYTYFTGLYQCTQPMTAEILTVKTQQ